MTQSHRIFIDWGTTNFRAYLVGERGEILDVRESDAGIKRAAGSFEDVLRANTDAWIKTYPIAAIVCAGMIGGDLGWLDVKMVPCPANLLEISRHLHCVPISSLPRIFIVPGVYVDGTSENTGMMRGEEVLLFGSLDLEKADSGRFCFPGTHSKWIHVENSTIQSIETCMTGETFALLRTMSVLSRSLDGWDGEIDEASFLLGVQSSRSRPNPLQSAFAVRSAYVQGKSTDAPSRGSYLSGVLIGAEIGGFANHADWPVTKLTVVCERRLAHLYQTAAQTFGVDVEVLEHRRAFVAGATAIFENWLLTQPDKQGYRSSDARTAKGFP